MSLPYMKMYWGDYLGDTAHLTAIEHGGYLLLIAHYWRTGSIPTDTAKLARVARMTAREWMRHGPTIMEFFPDGKHSRIERERDHAERKSAINKHAAEKRWSNEPESKSLKTLDVDDADALPLQSVRNANHNQNHNHNKKTPPLPPSGGDEFAEFWDAYPRKIGKGAAQKAWRGAVRKASAEDIIAAVKRFTWPEDKTYIPHPSTWLNAERWADEPPVPAAPVYVPTYHPPGLVYARPPDPPAMSDEDRAKMAARFDDLLKSLGKNRI